MAARNEAARREAMADLEDGEEPVRNGRKNGKGSDDEDDEISEEDDDDSSSSDGGAEDSDNAMEVDKPDEQEQEPASNERTKQTERILAPAEVRAHLRRLFKNEAPILSLIYAPHGPLATEILAASSLPTSSPFDAPDPSSSSSVPRASADIFFMEVISVPPTRFRPAATMGDLVFENPQNSLLNSILRQTFVVRDQNLLLAEVNAIVDHKASAAARAAEGKQPLEKTRVYTMLLESLIGLQVAVNSMIDSTKNPMVMRNGKLPPMGVKQMLEKKDGLFRKNMMVCFLSSFLDLVYLL